MEMFPALLLVVGGLMVIYLVVLSIIQVTKRYCNYCEWRDSKTVLPWNTVECYSLLRSDNNPILSPDAASYWQSEGTFNPAALLDSDGNVHVLYRTIGDDGVSRLGYMMSENGLSEWQHMAYPVYEADSVNYSHRSDVVENFNPNIYMSGGSWVGCEDPRLAVIDDTVYLLYVAFGGWDSMRIAYATQSLKDFRMRRFNWSRSKYLSPPGELNKNWLLFPEKIRGKFAILYNIWPRIGIHYVDRLEDLQYNTTFKGIKSWTRHTFPGMPDSWIMVNEGTAGQLWVDPAQLDITAWGNEDRWDTWLRGAGPTPIKTDIGWLLIYHAMDKKDPHRFKIGVMILSYTNPEQVLYKAPVPLLSPDAEYENDYKNGVLYACGAIIKNQMLLVYYGGGDKHVCVAQTSLPELLDWLQRYPLTIH